MPAVTLDLTIEQGALFQAVFTWTENGVPVNLTGYTARMDLRRTVDALEAAVRLTTEGGGGIFLGGITGAIGLIISADVTSTLTPRVPKNQAASEWGVYDLQLIDPGGDDVERLAQGRIFVSPAVTRA